MARSSVAQPILLALLVTTGCKAPRDIKRGAAQGLPYKDTHATEGGDAAGAVAAKPAPVGGSAPQDVDDETTEPAASEDLADAATDTATSEAVAADFSETLDLQGPSGPGAFIPGFRTSNDFFTNMTSSVEGLSPHGFVRVWYSKNLEAMINRPTFKAPVGSVAIKKFQNATASGYAIMIKKPAGYDPAHNDWHYEVRKDDGTLTADPPAGKIASCIGCHTAAKTKDYLAATELGRDPEDIDAGASMGGKDPDLTPADPLAPTGPGAFKADFVTSKDFFTSTPDPVLGTSPHGKVRVWYSANLKNLLANAKIVAPIGTVAIKEFDNDGKPGVDGVVVMVKKSPGFAPKNHDWSFEARDAWGQLLPDPASGKSPPCSGCHAAAQATDFLAATKLTSSGSGGPGGFAADYATSDKFFTRMRSMGPESGPHGSIRIWYSVNAKATLGVAGTPMPGGTVAIARYKKGADMGHVVMVKQPGSDALNADWHYETRDRYGNLLWDPRPGPIATCVGCHKQAASTDYMKGHALAN